MHHQVLYQKPLHFTFLCILRIRINVLQFVVENDYNRGMKQFGFESSRQGYYPEMKRKLHPPRLIDSRPAVVPKLIRLDLFGYEHRWRILIQN